MKFKVRAWPSTFAGRLLLAAATGAGAAILVYLEDGELQPLAIIVVMVFVLGLEEANARWLHYAKMESDHLFLHEGRSQWWVKYVEIYQIEVQGGKVVLDCHAKSWLIKRRTKVSFKPENLEPFLAELKPRVESSRSEPALVVR